MRTFNRYFVYNHLFGAYLGEKIYRIIYLKHISDKWSNGFQCSRNTYPHAVFFFFFFEIAVTRLLMSIRQCFTGCVHIKFSIFTYVSHGFLSIGAFYSYVSAVLKIKAKLYGTIRTIKLNIFLHGTSVVTAKKKTKYAQ